MKDELDITPLSPSLTRAVLSYLGMHTAPPTLDLLNIIVTACTRTVPWESAFRIAKRARTPRTADCPRWPDEFWADAIARGGGGTCFESNYALFSLLHALGYEGYLTINNMGEKIGCHAAIVLHIDGERWLVDGGIPLYVSLRIDSSAPTRQDSAFHTYTVRPDGENVYQIERTKHPKPNCYTLIDTPIPDDVYRAATTADYGANGHFLDRIIICKVVGERAWRFCSSEMPLHIESFWEGERTDHLLDGNVAKTVSTHFGMDVATVRAALAATTPWEASSKTEKQGETHAKSRICTNQLGGSNGPGIPGCHVPPQLVSDWPEPARDLSRRLRGPLRVLRPQPTA